MQKSVVRNLPFLSYLRARISRKIRDEMTSTDKEILQIALPSILSNITVPLLGMVDVAIMGHLGQAQYIGAIAVGSMIFNVMYWLCGFLRMGTGGMTSQAYGERNHEKMARILLRSMLIALLLALGLLVLQEPICRSVLAVMSPAEEVASMARRYFAVCIWGAPAMLGLYSLTGWFVGMQNTRIPMFIAIVQNVVNIGMSLLFVAFCGMTIEGVALGTLVAQYAGLALGLFFFFRRYFPSLHTYFHLHGITRRAELSPFFHIHRDIFLRTVFLVAVNLFFTSAGAAQGVVILAVNTLLLQLFTIFSYVMDGFAYAGEALGGKYYGANNRRAFLATVTRLFLWGGGMIVVFSGLYLLGGRAFLSLLTSNKEVVAAALPYFPWAVLIPLSGMAAFVWDGLLIGTTQTRGMLVSSVLSAILFFMVYWLLRSAIANHALWLSFLVYLFSRGAIQTFLFMRHPFVRTEGKR